jgi:hypothetical protein
MRPAREYCSGSEAECPRDDFVPRGVVCRAAAAECDAPEVCSGVSRSCPADRVAPAGSVCRQAASACDEAEQCDGLRPVCPDDRAQPAGVQCGRRRRMHQCGEPTECAGWACSSEGRCELRGRGREGAACDDDDPCTEGDQCRGTECVGDAGGCESDCNGRGTCCAGACVCDAEWAGSACEQTRVQVEAAAAAEALAVARGERDDGAQQADGAPYANALSFDVEFASDASAPTDGVARQRVARELEAALRAAGIGAATRGTVRVRATSDVDGEPGSHIRVTLAAPLTAAALAERNEAALGSIVQRELAADTLYQVRENAAVRVVVRGQLGAGKDADELLQFVADEAARRMRLAALAERLGASAIELSTDGTTGDTAFFVVLREAFDGAQVGADLAQALRDHPDVVDTQLVSVVASAAGEPPLGEAAIDECPDNDAKLKRGDCGCAIGDIDGDRIEDCVDRDYVLLRYNWPIAVPLYVSRVLAGELRLEPFALSTEPFVGDRGSGARVDVGYTGARLADAADADALRSQRIALDISAPFALPEQFLRPAPLCLVPVFPEESDGDEPLEALCLASRSTPDSPLRDSDEQARLYRAESRAAAAQAGTGFGGVVGRGGGGGVWRRAAVRATTLPTAAA